MDRAQSSGVFNYWQRVLFMSDLSHVDDKEIEKKNKALENLFE